MEKGGRGMRPYNEGCGGGGGVVRVGDDNTTVEEAS